MGFAWSSLEWLNGYSGVVHGTAEVYRFYAAKQTR